MPNYDNIVLGVENSQHPANQKETELSDLEYQMELNSLQRIKIRSLESKLKEIKELCEGMSENNGLAILILNKL